MRVFVTGATGYVGSAICAALLRRHHDVVGLARNEQSVEKLQRHGVHPVIGTLTDARVLREMTHDADAVVHAAADMAAGAEAVDATALEAMLSAIDTDHEAFLYTSGTWNYGNTGDAEVDESAPLDAYKMVAWRSAHEQRVHEGAKHRLRTVVIRPGIVYGGEGGMIVGGMLESARDGSLRVVGDGNNVWPCVDRDALGDLYALALEEAPHGAIYNAVSDHVRYGELAAAVWHKAGRSGEPAHVSLDDAAKQMGPFAEALAGSQRVSSARARTELGWHPTAPTLLEWVRSS